MDPAFAAIAERLNALVVHEKISGAVTLLARPDRLIHWAALGESDQASGREMKRDDLFWIASLSKPITALGIALLVDEGRLTFDDPVEKVLPEFRGQWVLKKAMPTARVLAKSRRPITIRDLLSHTSGISDYPVIDPHWSLAEASRMVAREPLYFQPGTQCKYSTSGFDVLGRMIEVAGGLPFAEFLQRRLFIPLGMRDTTFWVSGPQRTRLAVSYRLKAPTGGLEPADISFMYGSAVTDRARAPLGGAGLFSTAGDIVKIYQMMLKGGKVGRRQMLRPETVREMTRKQTGKLLARPGLPWGLGFCLVEDPSQMASHAAFTKGTFGHGGAFGTNSWADPARGLIYILMIQRAGLLPSPDDSDVHQAFQQGAALALRQFL